MAVWEAAIKAFPEYYEFGVLRKQCMEKHWLLENKMRIQGKDKETVNRMLNSGQLERVAYPWIASKELERSAKAMKKLNAQFEAASENACIQRSSLKGATSRPIPWNVKTSWIYIYILSCATGAKSSICKPPLQYLRRSLVYFCECAIPEESSEWKEQ